MGVEKKKRRHILVVSQYFYPEQFRINDICTEWVKRGYKVTVLTGIPNYPQGEYYEGYDLTHKRTEEWNGVKIIRIPIAPRGKNAIGMIKNYLSFVASGYFWSKLTKIDADVVFNYEVSPMTQALVGMWYAKKRKIPCYLYVTDLWPDNVEIVTGIHNRFFIGSINVMVNHIYKNCTRIFTSSKSFIDKMVERGVPKAKIRFWPQYAEEFYKPYQILDREELETDTSIPQDDIFNILFAGNIGYAQGLEVLVQAGELLQSEGIQVRFNIVGDGRYKEELVSLVKEKELQEYFNFIDRQPAESIPKFMAASQAALICLSKSEVFAMTIPAKTQSCMACGMPILVVADGEVQEIIKEAKCGFGCSALDAKAFAKNIKKMLSLSEEEREAMGRQALLYYKENFDREMLLDKIDKYLKGSK